MLISARHRPKTSVETDSRRKNQFDGKKLDEMCTSLRQLKQHDLVKMGEVFPRDPTTWSEAQAQLDYLLEKVFGVRPARILSRWSLPASMRYSKNGRERSATRTL
eukprot:TRINITY_DN13138_c0_g1_i1.p3 TRINITY_DN13138_c0_g1~~TRINITY_DN13138_c0_g1_i1.p3  ORF type:complete len:105 (+),score=11.82 TRINITY_DN13138_c0_g1_i1:340-654(+)